MIRGRSRALHAGWGVADQALCSLTSLALGALVARAVAPSSFGAFGLAFSTYLIMLGVCRAVVAEPLVVRFSAVTDPNRRTATRAATGAAVAMGATFGLGCAALGLVGLGLFSQALLSLSPALPGLLLQDTWRYAFFAEGRGSRAFANDLACSVPLLGALAVLSHKTSDVAVFVLVWGLAGWAAALLGMLQTRILPAPLAARGWLRGQRDLALPFLGEFAALGAGELAIFGVGGLVGLAAVGALRAGQILLGPLRVLFMGFRLVAIPDGVRLLENPQARPRRAAALLSAALALTALAWGGLLLLLPGSVGEALLGDSWNEARAVVAPLTFAMAGTGAVTGAFIGLRALAAASRSLRARVLIAPFMFVGAVVGAAVAGAPGSAAGTGIVIWLSLGIWWRQFQKALDARSVTATPRPLYARAATVAPHGEASRA